MRISSKRLRREAEVTRFRPEVLEKVIHLLNLLEGFLSHPFLKDRLALKGGRPCTCSSSTCRGCWWTSTSTTSAPWTERLCSLSDRRWNRRFRRYARVKGSACSAFRGIMPAARGCYATKAHWAMARQPRTPSEFHVPGPVVADHRPGLALRWAPTEPNVSPSSSSTSLPPANLWPCWRAAPAETSLTRITCLLICILD